MSDMKNKYLYGSSGFTLLETLIALVVGSILMAAILMLSVSAQQAASGIKQKVSVEQDVRAALDVMAAEISMASYSPAADKTGVYWLTSGCAASKADNNRGIPQADGSNLSIEMDLDGDNLLTGTNEFITYAFANKQITRAVGCGATALTFIGGTNVNVINDSATPVFRYYDANGVEISSPGGSTIKNIRRITITLAVQSLTADMKGEQRTMIYSTNVMLRNHAISLM
jgi:prepilin-type N-terminal cleavage/methylation domain-containing protein